MLRIPQLLVNQLYYSISNTSVQFQDVTLSFQQKHYGIVGDNGIGKSTLLKLITGLIFPQHGHIQRLGQIVYFPQNPSAAYANATVAEALHISQQLRTLAALKCGDYTEEQDRIINDEWDIETRAKQILEDLDLHHVHFDDPFSKLSGGQKTKCLLARIMLAKADFILLDEPTNNLDHPTRQTLYRWIRSNRNGLLIASHDRELLDHMDEIVEISTNGINSFGGNFTFYQNQKSLMQAALQQEWLNAKRKIKYTEQSIQQTLERHAQRRKKGKSLRKEGKIDKLTAHSMRGRSERSQRRNVTQAETMLQRLQEHIKEVKARLEIKESIQANLNATAVPNGKILISIDSLYFSFPMQPPLFKDFNFVMLGPERIAIRGPNGSGKTTLVKIILNELIPHQGHIIRGTTAIRYLDQQMSFLQPTLSLIENFQYFNPSISTQEAYFALASFNFRNKDADKRVCHLSGGECMRAGLAISLLAKIPPQLIILDEPTNHLDLRSLEAIEQALGSYKGGLIVISHDARFLSRIGISKEINLG